MKKSFIFLITIYKYILSPFLPICCRFTPTCSEYAIEAINKHGVFKGMHLSLRRLLRCHPFHPGGYDPIK